MEDACTPERIKVITGTISSSTYENHAPGLVAGDIMTLFDASLFP
jgi:hypothetical protein